MTERVDDMVTVARAGTARYPRDEVHEVADFLEWLLKGNFVLLGAREYDISEQGICVVADSGLGILRDEERSTFATSVPLSELPPGVRERATSGDLLLVAKTNAALAGAQAGADGLRRRPPRLADAARSSASRGCSGCSRRRRTPSARRRRRCCTASCARRSTRRT